MNDETKPVGLWERTKAWADKNRTISGALVGGAAGTIVPGLGTVIGAIVGAGVGFASSKEKKEMVSGAARLIPENAGPQLRCPVSLKPRRNASGKGAKSSGD